MSQPRTLDVGCGINKYPGAIGIDRNPASRADVLCDLDNVPYPFADSSFDQLRAIHVIEHVSDVIRSMEEFHRLVRPGGRVALCFLGRFCLWETLHFLLQGKFAKAFRRCKGKASSAMEVTVFYPKRSAIVSAFHPSFRLRAQYGIGVSVPPSYVTYLSARTIARLSSVDRKLTHRPLFRSLADHRLYIFERI